MTRRFLAPALAALLVVLAPAIASAENSFQTWGPHVGFSSDPSQVVLGGHLEMGNIAPQIDFVPGVDLGIGDNLTLVSLSGDFRYRIPVAGATWQPYAGAGIALHFFSWDSGLAGHGSNVTRGGGELIGGADVPTKSGSRFFVEGRFALGDGPTFKALAGWCFKMH